MVSLCLILAINEPTVEEGAVGSVLSTNLDNVMEMMNTENAIPMNICMTAINSDTV